MQFDINWNLGDFFKGLDKAEKVVIDELRRGLVAAGEALRYDSLDIVPFDKGFNGGLAGTARTSDPKNEPDGVSVEVSYNKDYAVKVHEDMTLNINQTNTASGQKRQQKYLEKPMKENAEKYGKMVADHLRSALNG